MLKKRSSYVVWFLKLYLIFLGEGLKKYGNWVYYCYGLYLVISYPLMLISMFLFVIRTDDRILRVESFDILIAVSVTLIFGLTVKLNKNVILKIIKFMNESDDDFIESSNEAFLFLLKVVIVLLMICEIPYLLCPIFLMFTNDVKICDPDSFYILSEVPWNCNSLTMYLVTMCYHIVLTIHPMMCFYSTSLALSSMYAVSFTKFSQLLTRIRDLVPDKTDNQGEIMNSNLDNLIHNRFKEFVKHYQLYVGSTTEITRMLSATSNTMLVCITIILIGDLSIHGELQVPILKKMRCLCTTIILLVHLFISCYVGDHTEKANEQIRNALYTIPWYRLSMKMRKTLVTFMVPTQCSSTVIKVYGVYPMNINFSVAVLNNIYSGLNMYLSTYKKTE